MIGTSIAHYKVTAKLGAGGMGEVYRATDTKLGRDVALKVLPEAFSADPQRMQRFQREAQVLASLNHPNIAAIYGLEEKASALVMELVPGPTLTERIAQGALPIEEALSFARQIADALEYAHEHGIIHRDLKPANIKLTADGQVKVLDFGLAKALQDDASAADNLNSPTLSMAATRAGIILGTASYMSPEQARGGGVDRRTDIWAFGVVLFEMLSGRRLFDEPTASDALAAVLKSDLNLTALPSNISHRVRRLIARCLERDRKKRLQAIGEARIALEEAIAHPESDEAAASVPARGATPSRINLGWVAVSFLAVAFSVAALGWYRASRPTAQPVARFTWQPPPGGQMAPILQRTVAISPDGRLMAAIFTEQGKSRIFVRPVDSFEGAAIAGTESPQDLFFSPDGQWIGFFSDGQLRKARIGGGALMALAPGQENRGGDWGPNGTLVYTPTATSPLFEVSEAGGQPKQVTQLDATKGERTHRWPHVLPSGKAVLFTVGTVDSPESYDDSRIDAVILATGERRTILQGASSALYIPVAGLLLYTRSASLFAVPFDPDALQVRGTPMPVLQGVEGESTTGAHHVSVSANGALVYVPGVTQGGERTFAWVDRKGQVQTLPTPPRPYAEPALSPDGKQIAVSMAGGKTSEMWIFDLQRATLGRLTFEEGSSVAPLWSNDSKRVAYFLEDSGLGKGKLFWRPADGSSGPELLLETQFSAYPGSFSPDGKWLAIDVTTSSDNSDILVMPMTGDRKPVPFVTGKPDEFLPRFSPDGRWLAYQSNETGRYEVYVKAFPGPGGRWQVSNDGGGEPHWSPDGREIFYRRANQLLVADVSNKGGFQVGTPRVLLDPFVAPPGTRNGVTYGVSPDGKRFLSLRSAKDEKVNSQVNVVLNWAEELRRMTTAAKEK